MQFIDTHCHLDSVDFENEVGAIVAHCKRLGVEQMLIPGADLADLPKAVNFAEQFSEIYFEDANYDDDFTLLFDSKFSTKDYYTRNSLNLSNKGIHSDDQNVCGLITKTNHSNAALDIDVDIKSFQNNGYVSILMNVKNYTKNAIEDSDGGDNANTFQGYRLEFDGSNLYLKYVDYNRILLLKRSSYDYKLETSMNLKLIQEGNTYTAYIDDVPQFSIVSNIGNLNGAVGMMLVSCNAYVEAMNLETM